MPALPELTLEQFMAQAYAMECEAVERYTEFADMLETANNPEVAALFRTMAGYEAKHAEQILAQMGWTQAPPPPPGLLTAPGMEAPEAMPIDEAHYLMQPWHALQIALTAERRAQAFFALLARMATTEPVRTGGAGTAGRGDPARRTGAGLAGEGAGARPGLGGGPRPAALHRLKEA